MELGLMPALKIRVRGGAKCFAVASAIWLRHALSSQRKRMFRSICRRRIGSPRSRSTSVWISFLDDELGVEDFLYKLALFCRPFDFIFDVVRCGDGDGETLRIHCATDRLDALFPAKIQSVGDTQQGAQLAHHVLVGRAELAEAEMFLAGMSLAVIASDVGDQLKVELVERFHAGALDQIVRMLVMFGPGDKQPDDKQHRRRKKSTPVFLWQLVQVAERKEQAQRELGHGHGMVDVLR